MGVGATTSAEIQDDASQAAGKENPVFLLRLLSSRALQEEWVHQVLCTPPRAEASSTAPRSEWNGWLCGCRAENDQLLELDIPAQLTAASAVVPVVVPVRLWRSASSPAATLLRETSPSPKKACKETQGPLIDMFYVVGKRVADASRSRSKVSGDIEPCVLFRYPQCAEMAEGSASLAMIEMRIASFCLAPELDAESSLHGATVVTGVPFAFTILASVLPADDSSGISPQDLLYCTAVCFDEEIDVPADDGSVLRGAPHAFCVVSRHPFISAFGEACLQLHAGKSGSETSCSPVSNAEGELSCSDCDHWGHRLKHWADFMRAVTPKVRKPQTRRAQTDSGAPFLDPNTGTSIDRGRDRAFSDADTVSPSQSVEKEQPENCPLRFSYMARASGYPSWVDESAALRCDALMSWAAVPLFRRLSHHVILQLLAAMLLELRVLVVSKSVELGSAVVLGLSALLWPWSWQHLLLPICPESLQEAILDTPVPFLSALPRIKPKLVRMLSNRSDSSVLNMASSSHGVVICNADQDQLSIPADVAKLLGEAHHPILRCPASRLAELQPQLRSASETEARVIALAMCAEVHSSLLELASEVLVASKAVEEPLGTACWREQMEAIASPEQAAFYRVFVNTQMCLMFLQGKTTSL